MTKICPKCKSEIDYLDFDVTGTCSSSLYPNEDGDYDVACLTDGVEFDNFRCPECSEILFDTEEEAKEFLNSVEEKDE